MAKSRAGRKRKAEAQREPNGRVAKRSPVERAREATAVAEAGRLRHGVRPKDVTKAEAEHILGKALLLTSEKVFPEGRRRRLIATATEYEQLHRDYRVVLGAKPLGSASDYDRGPSYDGSEGDDPAYVDRCNRIRQRMADCRRALLLADPMALFAVETWAIERKPIKSLVGPLLLGLDALAKIFADEGRIAA
jgi:hypothetical protein